MQGGRPRSWSLRDDYDKFMQTKEIREVLLFAKRREETQCIIEFALVLEPERECFDAPHEAAQELSRAA